MPRLLPHCTIEQISSEMKKLFNKILIPTYLNGGSAMLLETAADIAVHYNCSLHLVHVVPFDATSIAIGTSGVVIPQDIIPDRAELEARLNELCISITAGRKTTLQTGYSLVKGTWNEVIIDMVKRDRYDLVLIAKKKGLIQKLKDNIDPDNIAHSSNVPVISIPGKTRLTALHSIIVPVTDFLPVTKLIYGIYLSRCYHTTLRLLGIDNEQNKDRLQYYLTKAYGLVKDNCNSTLTHGNSA
ncbi:MAG: universal stress protein [Pedobacter sp.]|nr:MAG: universal stress protein [Pedobacter sp.]